jgi:hypothetical protein
LAAIRIGVGARHQTGWTLSVASLLLDVDKPKAELSSGLRFDPIQAAIDSGTHRVS